MRILAIGDIHGCATALDALLGEVMPTPTDVVITLGDYVDRGPNSAGVIDRLLQLQRQCDLFPLCGNHEQMMLEERANEGYMHDWLAAGGTETLASYGKPNEPGCLALIPNHHWFFLENLLGWHETEHHFFVHANAYPNRTLSQQPGHMLRWESLRDPLPHYSGKIMVCGHTQQRSGVPLNLGHAICIDTWAYGKGWLTCLDVVSGKVWQANEAGASRTAWIDDFALKP